MKPLQSDLDSLYVAGKITEDEYLHLATEDVNVLAIAVDKIDGFTTVSLMKEASKYSAEVLYPFDHADLDEKFMKHEASLKTACDNFENKITYLQRSRGHDFEVTWYIKK